MTVPSAISVTFELEQPAHKIALARLYTSSALWLRFLISSSRAESGCAWGRNPPRVAVLARHRSRGLPKSMNRSLRIRVRLTIPVTMSDIVTGTVRRRERSDIFVDLGKAEAIMPGKEQVPGEEYAPGDRIRSLLLEIENTSRGPELILSRASQKFVRRLFELEVTEIADGTVKIEAFAREPGYRTKIAVSTTDPKVDPVGACVGARGARVKSIVRELGGEKIDIVRYFTDPREMVAEALKPAVLRNIIIDEKNRRVGIVVSEDDLAVAIGKKGQNARLTSRLIGWKLEIMKQQTVATTLEEKKGMAASGLTKIPGIDDATAQRLVVAGFSSLELFDGVEGGDLVGAGFTPEEADDILKKVAAFGSPAK